MDVTLVIRAEPIEPGTLTWWATARELPGFTTSDDTLPALLARSEIAIREIAEAEGYGPVDRVRYELEAPTPQTDNPSPMRFVPEHPVDAANDGGGPTRSLVAAG